MKPMQKPIGPVVAEHHNAQAPAAGKKVGFLENARKRFGKTALKVFLGTALAGAGFAGVKHLAAMKSAEQKERQGIEQRARNSADASKRRIGTTATVATTQARNLTNNVSRLKEVYSKRVNLTKSQQNSFNSIVSISQRTGIGSARVLQTIFIHEKAFANPNYQRLTSREKEAQLGTGNPQVIMIGNAFAQLPQSERNAIRSLTRVRNVKEKIWEIAGEERLRANQDAMGFR
ncbi:MAG: hypothetical protein WCW44_06245 [archaeon]|jgi:hypothetical protein